MRTLFRLAVLAALLLLPTYAQAAGGKCVALTFDDGPSATLTPRLLDILEDEHAVATFFVVGQNVRAHPEIVRRAYEAGNEIGNHSWSHPNFFKLSSESVASQISKTDAAIKAAIGIMPRLVRPPYGNHNARIDKAIGTRPIILWDIDTLDWKYRNVAHVTNAAEEAVSGQNILMHDIHASTVASVRGIIDDFKKRGYGFVTVSELLAGKCSSKITVANLD